MSGDFSKTSFSNFTPISIIFWTEGWATCEVLARRRCPTLQRRGGLAPCHML